jgi:signal transduction histidine kinase
VAQEALTNTLKHAGPARAELTIRYGPDTLEVTAVDDGRGPAGRDTPLWTAASPPPLVRLRSPTGGLGAEPGQSGAGPDGSGAGPDGSGHGLVGMRERVTLFGGELQTGAGPDGGFRVVARFPLHGGTG